MKKSVLITAALSASLLFGGVAGASVTQIIHSKEGLKDSYSEKAELDMENFILYDLRAYEEEKVVQLEEESDAYYEAKLKEYKESQRSAVEGRYEEAKEEVFGYIDKLFNGDGK